MNAAYDEDSMELAGQALSSGLSNSVNSSAPTVSSVFLSSNSSAESGGTNGSQAVNVGHRRRRALSTLTDAQTKTLEKMKEFYIAPNLDLEAKNITWFDHIGQSSADNHIALNLSSYISEHFTRDQLIEMGYDITEMLQECSFKGEVCGPQDFYKFYDIKYGNCFTFNSGMDQDIAKIVNPGASFGLSMVVNINQNTYIPALTQEAGIRVLLHRQGEVPIMDEDGFDVGPGSKSNVAVKYMEFSRLDNCESNASNEAPFYPGNYTRKGCLKGCLQSEVIKQCKCASANHRRPAGMRVCVTDDEYSCAEDLEHELLDNGTCPQRCLLPCWESQYEYIISTSQWPSSSYQPTLIDSYGNRGNEMKEILRNVGEHFLKINIYYDDLNHYVHAERRTMTFPDFLGAIGGHVGLWIGITLVSLFEVFELVYNLAFYFITKFHAIKSAKTSRRATVTPVQCFVSDPDLWSSKRKLNE